MERGADDGNEYPCWVRGDGGLSDLNSIRSNCDLPSDILTNFTTVLADEIEDIGWKGVIKRIRDRVGDTPVYLTIDIDTLDPAFAVSVGLISLSKD